MTSLNHFDSRSVTWRLGERRVARDDRRIERLCQGYVHGVVRSDVLAQLPRASQEIMMGVTVEIEVGEIRNCFGRAVRWHVACPDEASGALGHFNVRQVGEWNSCWSRKRASTLGRVARRSSSALARIPRQVFRSKFLPI